MVTMKSNEYGICVTVNGESEMFEYFNTAWIFAWIFDIGNSLPLKRLKKEEGV